MYTSYPGVPAGWLLGELGLDAVESLLVLDGLEAVESLLVLDGLLVELGELRLLEELDELSSPLT